MGRGLSPLQQEILEHAREKGFITPRAAREYAWTDEYLGAAPDDQCSQSDNPPAAVAASASRALRRLCDRGILVYEQSELIGQDSVYRLAGWSGPLPWVESRMMTRAKAAKEIENQIFDQAMGMIAKFGPDHTS